MHDFAIVHFDGEFAALVEAAGREIDGADDGAFSIGENELGVELELVQFVDFDADVVEGSQAGDAF